MEKQSPIDESHLPDWARKVLQEHYDSTKGTGLGFALVLWRSGDQAKKFGMENCQLAAALFLEEKRAEE